jgi:hypothetical protein
MAEDVWLNELERYCETHKDNPCKAEGCVSIPPAYCLVLIKEIREMTHVANAYMAEVVDIRRENDVLKKEISNVVDEGLPVEKIKSLIELVKKENNNG